MCQRISYVIRRGDTLYNIARKYNTTVPSILLLNPRLNPRNLQIGSTIILCPNTNFFVANGMPVTIMGAENPRPMSTDGMSNQQDLINDMRKAWSQHVYWTRMLLISIAERLADLNDVTENLMQNPADIAEVFSEYYPANVARAISKLLSEHLEIGADIITSLRDGKKNEADELNKKWYINADEMAKTFASINPYYKYDALRQMLYNHLDLTTSEIAMRFSKNYPADISAFNTVENEALDMADYFTYGIMNQFPERFN